LQESEEHFRTIFETTPECVKLVKCDGTLLHMNSSGLIMVGAEAAEEVVGKNVYDLIAPEYREAFRNFNERICEGAKDSLEFDIVGLTGIRRNMETHAAPLRTPDGMIVQLGVTRDVTERKRVEQTLREEEARLAALATRLDSEVRLRTRELEVRNTEVVRQAEVLRELSNRLLQSQDNERRRVARELHDGVGQVLSAIGMGFAQLAMESERLSARGRQCLADVHEMVEQASQEIRTVSHLLHPPLLDELGLDSAVRWYVEGFSERSKIAVRTNLPPKFGRDLPRDVQLSLFRVVQECLTNIHRYSGSATAEVTISRSKDIITLEVSDKGKGIPAETLAKISAGESGGVGFRGMRERVRQFGGQLEIRSDEKGTRILVVLPVTGSTGTDAGTHGASAVV
jgi:PAS domain S-box-containing protein